MEIADRQLRGGQLPEGIAIGVDDEEIIIARDQGREVVADASSRP
jgi:hypothetical protein